MSQLAGCGVNRALEDDNGILVICAVGESSQLRAVPPVSGGQQIYLEGKGEQSTGRQRPLVQAEGEMSLQVPCGPEKTTYLYLR